MSDSRIRPLPPEGLDSPRRGLARVAPFALVVVVIGLVIGIGILVGDEDQTDPTTSMAASPPATSAEQVGLLGNAALWVIDPLTLEANPIENYVGEVPWHATITSRQAGDVYFLGPEGDVDLGDVAGTVYAVMLMAGDANLPTRLPAALVPIWSGLQPRGFDLIYAREDTAEATWADIVPLPGCGKPFPIAEPDATDALTVWCTEHEDVRVLVEFPEPAITSEALVVDWTGAIWTTQLGAEARFEPSGSIRLGDGDQISDIATLSADGQTLFLGISTGDDRTGGRSRASRMLAYDRVQGRQLWGVTTVVPFETVTVGPDGTIFAYYSAAVGAGPHPAPSLITIDPDTGESAVLIGQLKLGPGRLVILRR